MAQIWLKLKTTANGLKTQNWDTFYIYLALYMFIKYVSLIQMSPDVPEVIKEEFRKNLADGNEKYNEKWALNSVENLIFQWSGCGWSATGKTRATLKTLVRSPTIPALASLPATIPIKTRFDHFGQNLTWMWPVMFLQEGYLSPIVFARLESPISIKPFPYHSSYSVTFKLTLTSPK